MDMPVQSASTDINTMLQDAIAALQGAGAAAQHATARIQEQAADSGLKQLLQQGSEHAEKWQERLAGMASVTGGAPAGIDGNPIIDAIQQVGGRIIGKATDPVARDLGIIASGQLALHYYIAAFGTMTAYAKLLGMEETAQKLHECLQEAKQGDERYSELAKTLSK